MKYKVGDILEVSKEHIFLEPMSKLWVYKGFSVGAHSIEAVTGNYKSNCVMSETLSRFFKLHKALTLENK